MCNSLTITSAIEDLENKMVALIGKNNTTIWAKRRNGRATRSAVNLTKILMPMLRQGWALEFSKELISAIDKLKGLEEKFKSIDGGGGFDRTFCCIKFKGSSNTEEKISHVIDILKRLKELHVSLTSPKADSEESNGALYPTISWNTLFSPRAFEES